jgi:hypothetical protein
MKPWHWILVGTAALVLLYLLMSRQTATKLRSSSSTPSGLGGTLVGAGAAMTGASNLWDSIFNSDKSEDT